jgi:hypothetical protein
VDALRAQTAALAGQLRGAELAAELAQTDPVLYERVRPRFEKLFHVRWEELRQLQRDVEKGVEAGLCWGALGKLREECEALFRESLACVQGASMRGSGLDEGLCSLADALLDELARRGDGIRWDRFTILADAEAFAGMSGIIRLRFPETGLWNLPVAAHELGHFVGPKLERRDVRDVSSHPFQEVLEREATGDGWVVPSGRRPGARIRAFVHEFFADVFATYALGPAYACTCVILRLDPLGADREEERHPSALRRAHAIFRTLDAMNASAGGLVPPFAKVTRVLRDAWDASLQGAGTDGRLDPQHAARLDLFLDELLDLLRRELPGVRYDRLAWLRAERLADEMSRGGSAPASLAPGDGIADVLNAAWLARLGVGEEDAQRLARIESRALDACRTLPGVPDAPGTIPQQ